MSTAAPATTPKPPPAPPPAKGNGQATTPKAIRKFETIGGTVSGSLKAVVYGPGGVGKSELCANVVELGIKPKVLDIGDSTQYLDIDRIGVGCNWDEMRSILHDDAVWEGYDAIIIDDLTAAEEAAKAWTLANVKHEKGHFVNSVEGYGFGKGYVHVFETFMQLLGDLDAHHRKGRHIFCTAHECTAKVPNPAGEDYIRYEPRLQSADKSAIRLRVKEWCHHLLFVGYDIFAADGKASGGGTRMIYTTERPTHMAKHRSRRDQIIDDAIPYEQYSAEVWRQLLYGKQ